jgi:hypothetical protein
MQLKYQILHMSIRINKGSVYEFDSNIVWIPFEDEARLNVI